MSIERQNLLEIEFCIESTSAAVAAQLYGADRIEVCADLSADGLSPSPELIKTCRQVFFGEVYVMVRPRPGNFCYSENDITKMLQEIHEAADCGANGVVFGLLDENNDVDVKSCSALLNAALALNLDVTYHRAFDVCRAPLSAFDKILDLGFKRILTSGQQPTAFEGIDLIRELVKKASGKIEIMAGAGVGPQNAEVLTLSGVDALHFSVHRKGLLSSDPNYIDKERIEGVFRNIKKRS